MNKNYSDRLKKLKNRRFDDVLQKAILTESFSKVIIGDSLRYALEAMTEIDPGYTKNTYLAAEKIQSNLSEGLKKKNIVVEFRYQGSLETNTHIVLHSDIDILMFTKVYYTLEPPLEPDYPYDGDTIAEQIKLRNESFNVLNSIYKQVDNSGAKAITIYPTDPKREVDVVVCNWYLTPEHKSSGLERDKGIQIFDAKEKQRLKPDFPFLHIFYVNKKNRAVSGGLAKLVRLLKTLKVDADYTIKLSSFEITGLVYNMTDEALTKQPARQLLLLQECSSHLEKLVTDSNYRQTIKSPNDKEFVFGTDSSKELELRKLKLELDELIQDIIEEQSKKGHKINEEIHY